METPQAEIVSYSATNVTLRWSLQKNFADKEEFQTKVLVHYEL